MTADPWSAEPQPQPTVEDMPAYAVPPQVQAQPFTETPPSPPRRSPHVPSAAIGLGAIAVMCGLGVVGLDNAIPQDYGHGYVVKETVTTQTVVPMTITTSVRRSDRDYDYRTMCYSDMRRSNPSAAYDDIMEWCAAHSGGYDAPTVVTTEVPITTQALRDHMQYTAGKSRAPVVAGQIALGIGAILALAGAVGAYTRRRPEPAHTTSTRSGGIAGGLLSSVGALRDAYAQQRAERDVPPVVDYPDTTAAPPTAAPSEFAGVPTDPAPPTSPTTPAAAPSDDEWGF